MSRKHLLLKGTFILTATGFITRFMGFFYRIFLSHTFGEEGVGLYQLIFPVYALGYSLTCAGIELALSRLVARELTKGNEKNARQLLITSLFLTVSFSLAVTFFLQQSSAFLAKNVLCDLRCTRFLLILSYVFPFAAVHSCICGYYFGRKQTRIPALSQLLEQGVRILSVFLLYQYLTKYSISFDISIAVTGLIAGEAFSSLFCLYAVRNRHLFGPFAPPAPSTFFNHTKELLCLSAPLTASRILLNILQSIEAVSIPIRLQIYGMTVKESLSIYGVLTGMALPCILFPSAITNSVSTMLLPTVAEIQASSHRLGLKNLVKKVTYSCIFLGSICCVFFITFGKWFGKTLFHSPLAGDFIFLLAFMCPFLYPNNTLLSVINGIGKTTLSFFINTLSLGIRIFSVWILIPPFGILGYLYGLLASQICIFLLCIFFLSNFLKNQN